MTKKKKTTNAIVVSKSRQVQDLVNMFAGSSSLVQNDKTVERNLILRVAEAFEIPATCVNVMGGLPYINKDGLLFKLEEYNGSDIVSLTTKMVQYAIKGGDRAIAEATLVLTGGRTFNAVGEADDRSIKLAAVKMTPNMMAETRAQNRVIRRAIAAKMLRDLYTKLGGKKGKSIYDEQEKSFITNAVTSSAEEMSHVDSQIKRQEIIDQAPPPPPAIPKTKQGLVTLSIEKIQQATDAPTLLRYRDRIAKSGLYNENQKKMLYGAIDGKIKQYEK